MLGGEYFEEMENFVGKIRGGERGANMIYNVPWGGIQIIACGVFILQFVFVAITHKYYVCRISTNFRQFSITKGYQIMSYKRERKQRRQSYSPPTCTRLRQKRGENLIWYLLNKDSNETTKKN